MLVYDDIEASASSARADEVEAAFSAPPFFWREIELAPFAIDREMDWLRHCRLIGSPPLAETISDPEVFWLDAARLLWFVAHEPAAWLAPRLPDFEKLPTEEKLERLLRPRKPAPPTPEELDKIIREWMRQHIGARDMQEVTHLAYQILERAHTARAVAAPDEGGGSNAAKKLPCPPSAGNTSASSAEPVPACSLKTTSATTSRKNAAGATSTPTRSRKASPPSGRGRGTTRRGGGGRRSAQG